MVTAEIFPSIPHKSINELAAEQGVHPIRSAADLPAPVFESDEELEEFLGWIYAERHRDADLSRQCPEDWDDPEVWGPDEWP